MSATSSVPAALAGRAPLRAVGGSRRFLFYSNEMVGLGHLRRTLSIAGCLTDAHEEASSLILTGCAVEPFFRLPARTDTVKLPIRRRDADGTHHSRLLLDVDELRSMRAQIALATATAFDPDVAIIDKLPLGLGGELELTLESLRKRRHRCKVVLGLRDIDDSVENVQRKWGDGMRAAIERYYDAVVVYGPRSTPDALRCMGWDGLDIPVVHVGYVGAPAPTEGPLDIDEGYLLATAGAGNDGFAMLASVAAAIRSQPLPCHTVMVAGPLMEPADLECLRQLTDGLDITLCEFRNDLPNLIVGARAIVSMAGYNTVGEIMRARKPALFVPRVRPSEEQLIRSRMLEEAGLQQMLHPDDLSPEAMRHALGTLVARRRPSFQAAEYTGSERAAELLAAVAGLQPETPARKVRPLRRPRARIAIIASGFPRLSETFALNELRALDEQGRLAALFATKPGDPGATQPGTAALMERLEVLPAVDVADQAAIVAERLRDQGVTGIHGYFAHAPAEVAMLAARELDLPYGFSVHAADARKVTPEALAERVRGAACVVACNTDVAAALGAGHEHVHLIRHGVDVTRFSCAPPPGAEPLRLLAVGRLVEKKGFDVLIGAAARLTIPFRLRIVGDGPLREPLSRLVRDFGLTGRVELCGARTHSQLPSEYAAADLVVVPSVVDGRGDRDGLPNVVLEAMASTRPVVASDVADLGSAVIDGRTGLLVPPGDPTALAAALDSLLHRAELRRALGAEARRRVESEFELGRSTERFVTALEAAYV